MVLLESFFAALLGILVFMGRYLPKKDEKGNAVIYLQSAVKSMKLGADNFSNALMSVATPAGLASVIIQSGCDHDGRSIGNDGNYRPGDCA